MGILWRLRRGAQRERGGNCGLAPRVAAGGVDVEGKCQRTDACSGDGNWDRVHAGYTAAARLGGQEQELRMRKRAALS